MVLTLNHEIVFELAKNARYPFIIGLLDQAKVSYFILLQFNCRKIHTLEKTTLIGNTYDFTFISTTKKQFHFLTNKT